MNLSIFLIIVSFFLSVILSISPSFVETWVIAHLLIYVILIYKDFSYKKIVTLYQIWLLGYIYMIWSDIAVNCLEVTNGPKYISSCIFLTIANDIFLLGYQCNRSVIKKHNIIHYKFSGNKNTLFATIVLFLIIGIYSSWSTLVASFGGRQLSDTLGSASIVGVLTSAMGLIIPAIAAYYFNNLSSKSKWWSILFLVPLLIIQIILATRYKIIYVLLPFLIMTDVISLKKQKKKTLIILFASAILLSGVSSFLKENRTSGFSEIKIESSERGKTLFGGIANKMSPEGIVEMTDLSERWFSNHDHSYGKEISFMFTFVVPRSIWPNKPTPIDHWLIREYAVVPDSYSTASGFIGEIRADFGLFCLVVLFLWGWFLKRLDIYVEEAFSSDEAYFDKIFGAMLYPCVFFFVRSPLTSTQCLIFEIIIYLILRKLFAKPITIYK